MAVIKRHLELISYKPVFLANPRLKDYPYHYGVKTYVFDILDCIDPQSYYEPFLLIEFKEVSTHKYDGDGNNFIAIDTNAPTKFMITNGEFISIVRCGGSVSHYPTSHTQMIQLTNEYAPSLEEIHEMMSKADIDLALERS